MTVPSPLTPDPMPDPPGPIPTLNILVAVDRESAADIIVMGSREHSIWDRIFDPSAGRYVIDHAPCPVLVVR